MSTLLIYCDIDPSQIHFISGYPFWSTTVQSLMMIIRGFFFKDFYSSVFELIFELKRKPEKVFILHIQISFDIAILRFGFLSVLLYPPHNEVVGGVYWFHSVRPSVRLSVRPSVRPSRMPCPLCIIYSYGWILFILGTNDHYHERVCRAPWPLTLTYIFKVVRPWLRKSCPLCSVYSSG